MYRSVDTQQTEGRSTKTKCGTVLMFRTQASSSKSSDFFIDITARVKKGVQIVYVEHTSSVLYGFVDLLVIWGTEMRSLGKEVRGWITSMS